MVSLVDVKEEVIKKIKVFRPWGASDWWAWHSSERPCEHKGNRSPESRNEDVQPQIQLPTDSFGEVRIIENLFHFVLCNQLQPPCHPPGRPNLNPKQLQPQS